MGCKYILLFSMLVLIISVRTHQMSDTNANRTIGLRSKRYLDFIPLSRMFFRANIKDNVSNSTQFFAHAYGYRANYPIENRRRMRRSDVYDSLTELINQHGFDGRACILRTFCEASRALTPNSGIIFKLFKMIFSGGSSGYSSIPEGDEVLYPYLASTDCDELKLHCPLSLLNLSPYTDE